MRGAVLVAVVFFALACEPERATVRILGTSCQRLPDRRLALDVDVEAHEGLGGSVGRYCVGVQWPFAPSFQQQCAADLSDGDTKSLHFVSESPDHQFNQVLRVQAFTNALTGAEDVRVPP